MANVKITVLMVCYNQEKIIGKTLDSILNQKEFGLNEIVVGDDCSTDNTWGVLVDYNIRYPNIIRPIRNEHNLGIYGNLVNVMKNRRRSDLYINVSGDDPLCDGFFETVQNFILDNNINTKESVGIYSDWKKVDPNGNETIYRNNIVTENISLWSLFLRGKISGRSLLVSNEVIENFDEIILDQGLGLAESMYDSQFHLNIKKAYYMPVVTSIYYSDIGVSTKLKDKEWLVTQRRIKLKYLFEHYADSKEDENYIRYGLKKCDFIEKPSLCRFVSMFYYYEKGQIPGCRNTFRYTFLIFGSLFKNYLLVKRVTKNV